MVKSLCIGILLRVFAIEFVDTFLLLISVNTDQLSRATHKRSLKLLVILSVVINNTKHADKKNKKLDNSFPLMELVARLKQKFQKIYKNENNE